jgi:hypothetical protein
LRKRFKSAWVADIAGMHDVMAALQEGLCFRPEKTMCVRDDANPQHGGDFNDT